MGRIDLAQDSNSPSTRPYHTVRSSPSGVPASLSPPTSRPISSSGSNLSSKPKGHVRARVDMSSFSGMGTASSPITTSKSNPSTPKTSQINGRLSPNTLNQSGGTSVSRASPSVNSPNVTVRSGIQARTRARNNSEDLSNLSNSSGSSSLNNNGSSSTNVTSPKTNNISRDGGNSGANTISIASKPLRGHGRSGTSHHVGSIFPSNNGTSTIQPRAKITSLNRSRTPSPVRGERPTIGNRLNSNTSGLSSISRNGSGNSSLGIGPPSSPKKEIGASVFSHPNLAAPYESPITSPEQPQSQINSGNVRFSSKAPPPISSPDNGSSSSSNSSNLQGTHTKSGFYAHAYGRSGAPTSSTTHSRNNSIVSSRPISIPSNSVNSNQSSNSDPTVSPTFRTTVTTTPNQTSFQNQTFSAKPIFPLSANTSNLNSPSDPGLLSPTFETSSSNLNTPLLSPQEESAAAEAKKNRKILDLEITNKSLLAINAGLEVTKLKQAKEIRDLKRKVRQSLAGGGTLSSHSNMNSDTGGEKRRRRRKRVSGEEGDGNGNSEEEGQEFYQDADDFDSDFDSEEEDEEEDEEGNPELEAAHVRCKTLIDNMVVLARQSILAKYVHEEEIKESGTKVLHPLELELIEEEKRKKREEEMEKEKESSEVEIEVGGTTVDTVVTTNTGDDETEENEIKPFPSSSSNLDQLLESLDVVDQDVSDEVGSQASTAEGENRVGLAILDPNASID